MSALRWLPSALAWSYALLLVLSAGAVQAQPAAQGRLHIVVFGPGARLLSDVEVGLSGETAAGVAPVSTNADGSAYLTAPVGTHTIRLTVPKAQLPDVPTEDPVWRVDLSDIPIVEDEVTQLIVSLGASGAIEGLDLQAAETGQRSMQKEFEQALEEKPKGSVAGVITAAEGGGAVEGAHIYVRGAPIEAVSDAQGKFALELPAGRYQLSVIHPRFSTQSVPDVEVVGGETRTVQVSLSPASVELEEMVVTAPHIEGGIATLVAERRETSAVADVIGAEQIARSGDSNAAAALSRVTGLTVVDGKYIIVRGMGERYSSLMLNRLQVPSPDPTRRVVPLDLFPTGVIDSVVVQKTYSPDLPGEFGGGVVQLRSRSYPEEFLLSVSLTTGGNSQTTFQDRLTYEGGGLDWLGIDDGTRELPSRFDDPRGKIVPGGEGGLIEVPNSYSADDIQELATSLPNNYATNREFAPPDASLVLSVGNTFALRHAKIGFAAAAGYSHDYSTVINAINRTWTGSMGGSIRDDYRVDTYQRQVSLSGFLDWGVEFSEEHALKFTTMVLRQSDDNVQFLTGYNDNLGVDQRRTQLQWVEREVLLQQASGHHVFTPLNDFGVDWRYAWARASRLEPDRREYSYGDFGNEGGYSLNTNNGNERVYGDLEDDTHEVAFDLTQPFEIWRGLKPAIKAGAMFYFRDRAADIRSFEFFEIPRTLDTTLPPEQLFVPESFESGLNFHEITLATDSYSAEMQVKAGYAMLELPIVESFDITGGARLEHATIEVKTLDPFNRDADPKIAKLDNLDVLPAATATWRFAEDFQLRGGYSRTLNRPDFRELAETRYYDLESNLLYGGNPNVRRAVIDNYDLRLEWYYTSDESLSLAAFYKSFDDPIETQMRPAVEEIFTTINAPSARSVGLELEARKRFDFVASALDALYLAANFTWIESEVELDLPRGGTYRRPMQSQSPWVVNLQLGWDDTAEGGTGTAASLLYNVSGRRIRVVGDPNIDVPDIYEDPFPRLDFAFSQDLPHGFKLGARARNLLNPVQRWYQGDVLVRRYRRGIDAAVSLSWKY